MIGIDVIKNNIQFIAILLVWLFVGMYAGVGVFLLIPPFLFLLYANDRFEELLIGFIFILILSDSLEEPLAFAKSFKNIYIVLLFVFFVFSISKIEYKVKLYKYFVPYFIFALIGLIYSPVVFTSVQKLFSYTILFIMVPNFVVYCYERNGSTFFRNLIYFMFTFIVIGYLLRFYNQEISHSHGGRLRGVFGNPNGLGIFMVVFFLLFETVKVKFPYLFNRPEKIIFALIVLYITYKTGSRAALMAILLFYFFTWLFEISVFWGFFVFVVILSGMEVIILYLPSIIIALGLEKTFRVETLVEGSGRLIAWDFAWKNINDSFFIGKGLAFDEHLMRSNFEMLSKAGHEGGVHNTYLIMWLNTGLLGLISFLRGFFILFIKAGKNHVIAFPIMFSIMLSINFEPWLSASLNPYTIIYLVIITLLTEEIFNEELDEENDSILEEQTEMG